jgi:hypothetical protein
MKIFDAMGNQLAPGQKLYWKQADLYVDVVDVKYIDEGRIASLSLKLGIGVQAGKDKAEFPMFIRVVDPNAEKLIEKAMGAK